MTLDQIKEEYLKTLEEEIDAFTYTEEVEYEEVVIEEEFIDENGAVGIRRVAELVDVTPPEKVAEREKREENRLTRAKNTRARIAALLTAEQRAKWKKLRDEAVEAGWIALDEEWDLTTIAFTGPDAWIYSWKPGDPLPEELKRPRAPARFPTNKK